MPRPLVRASAVVGSVDHGFDHFLLAHDGTLTLHDQARSITHPLPLDEARLGDLTVAHGYYRTAAGREYVLRWPFGYDRSGHGPIRATPSRGLVLGHHHGDWLGVVNALRGAREDREGLRLLTLMTRAAIDTGSVLAAAWCERAAVILRRHEQYAVEVRLIEAVLPTVSERDGAIIADRLNTARRLATRAPRATQKRIVKPTRRKLSGQPTSV